MFSAIGTDSMSVAIQSIRMKLGHEFIEAGTWEDHMHFTLSPLHERPGLSICTVDDSFVKDLVFGMVNDDLNLSNMCINNLFELIPSSASLSGMSRGFVWVLIGLLTSIIWVLKWSLEMSGNAAHIL